MEDTTCIVACETLKPELHYVMQHRGCPWPVHWIDAGKHAWPDKLRVSIQETLDALPPGRRALCVFGFCGNAMVGINTGTHTLVLPRVADCIPLFIGSRKERESYGTATYFLTEGYINNTENITSDSSRVMQRYGESRGLFILKKMLGHYQNFAVIDTGTYDVANVQAKIEKIASKLDIPVTIIPGSLRYIDALLSCDWPADAFLIVPPGGTISLEDSLNAGQSQSTTN